MKKIAKLKNIRFKRKVSKTLLFGLVAIALALVAYKFRYPIKTKSSLVLDYVAINIFNKQNLIVETTTDIKREDISVVWYGDNPGQNLKLNIATGKVKIPLKEGNNSFVISYKDSIIGAVGHLKVSRYNYHNYKLKFYTKANKIHFDLNVEGKQYPSVVNWDELYHWSKSLSNHNRVDSALELTSYLDSIKYLFEFNIDQKDFKKLRNSSTDLKIKNPPITLNTNSLKSKSIKTRGRGTMNYPRKGFNIKLDESFDFVRNSGDTLPLKSFSILSLSMDHYYFKNRIAFELLKEIIGMDMYQAYSELRINNESQGVYLVTEHPKEHLFEAKHADFLLRRGYENSNYSEPDDLKDLALDYEIIKGLDKKVTAQYLDQYNKIYQVLKEKSGNELFEDLNTMVDLKEYMRILAFNFIICNGDYTDELFFYKSNFNPSNRFNVFPWDFDDIFANEPHEGWAVRNKRLDDDSKLIFSVEDDLDYFISSDPFLYQKYLVEMEDIITILNQEKLKVVFENTYKELTPFYKNDDIINQSQYDKLATVYEIEGLKSQMQDVYAFLINRMQKIEKRLKENR